MAYIRRLPSGKWQSTVRLPGGRRVTKTDPLRKVVADWARQQETKLAHHGWHDPRAGRITLDEWHRRWLTGRAVAATTADKDESRWRTHVQPRWGRAPLDRISRDELKGWVRQLVDARVGAWTVSGSATLLSRMLGDAVEAGLLAANPAAGLKTPRTYPKPPFFWTRDEARMLLLVLDEPWRTLVDLDMHVGLRWGELAGLRCQYIDLDHAMIHIVGVLTRKGWRDYPKSRKSRRSVPIPPHLRNPIWALTADRTPDDLLFTAAEGGPLDDSHFRSRIFTPALATAGVRRGSPHDMRHTAASWLVMDGVDLYRVQHLLGHEKSTTTERYAHLAPEAHEAIVASWATHPLDVRDAGDASVTHGAESIIARNVVAGL